jgi:hypothetical protein
MTPPRPSRKRTAAASSAAAALLKRQKTAEKASGGTASQPIAVDDNTQPSSLRQALAAVSQATDFESQVRDAVPEAAIVAPPEGSEAATIATTEVAVSSDEDELDAHLQDNFDSIDWSRLKKYCKPLRTSHQKKSWVYKYGYHVTLLRDMSKIFWICHDCHQRKKLDITGQGACNTTGATSSAAAHLRSVHGITKAGVVLKRRHVNGQTVARDDG